MMEELNIVKVGGGVLESEQSLEKFLLSFLQIPGLKILIHGGGRLADIYLTQLGIKPQMVGGRRVTDKDTLDVVTMVYGGLVNKQLVAKLQGKGCGAIGLTGADGNLIQSRKRPPQEVDYGYVGDPEQVSSELLTAMLAKQLVPVVAPLTHDGKGGLLNTNADTIASAIAAGMAGNYKVTLTYAFEKSGVLTDVADERSVLRTITEGDFLILKSAGTVHSGMLPKLESAFESLHRGIEKVRIVNFAALADAAAGTTISLKH